MENRDCDSCSAFTPMLSRRCGGAMSETVVRDEAEALRDVIHEQGSRMSRMRWTLERIIEAADGSSGLSWADVGDLARRALARDASSHA